MKNYIFFLLMFVSSFAYGNIHEQNCKILNNITSQSSGVAGSVIYGKFHLNLDCSDKVSSVNIFPRNNPVQFVSEFNEKVTIHFFSDHTYRLPISESNPLIHNKREKYNIIYYIISGAGELKDKNGYNILVNGVNTIKNYNLVVSY